MLKIVKTDSAGGKIEATFNDEADAVCELAALFGMSTPADIERKKAQRDFNASLRQQLGQQTFSSFSDAIHHHQGQD